jgi:sporulation protein YlmC with PRC-barrel domain
MNGQAEAIRMGWMAVALLPLLAGLAGAQVPAQATDQVGHEQQVAPSEPMGEFHPQLERASQLLGAKVVDSRGKWLGTIEDVVLTPDRSAIDYAVLSYGGFWGVAQKYFAVPWDQFQVRPGERVLVLNVSGKDLLNAKGFDENHWPATASERWMEGRSAAMATIPMRDLQYRRVSNLMRMTVRDARGQDLGRLRNIMIDTRQGKVAYAVLAVRSGLLEANKDMAVVPWSVVEILPQMRVARLNADIQTLNAVAFNARNFPNLENPQYSRQLYERFNVPPYWQTFGYVAPAEGMEPQGTSLWMPGSEYNSQFNPAAVETVQGTVQSVGTFRLEGTSIPGLSLQIRTDDGRMLTVHAGPYPYVEHQNIMFHPGDKVTITGAPARWNGRDIVMASQIRRGDKTLMLRDDQGKPQWNVNDLQSFESQNAPAFQGSDEFSNPVGSEVSK